MTIVKITVLETSLKKDLAEEYAVPNLEPCPVLKPGQDEGAGQGHHLLQRRTEAGVFQAGGHRRTGGAVSRQGLKQMTIRKYEENDIDGMIAVWNEIVEAGDAFPQEEPLTHDTGKEFFAAQTYTGVAVDEGGKVVGLYILHPNNVGRCGHICNASYAVSSKCRGRHIGEKLVLDCLAQAKEHGFGVLQFNAVVEGNVHARHLYERLGFTQLGTIPHGFRMKDGFFANICPYYKELA